jgi:hypothetical protein
MTSGYTLIRLLFSSDAFPAKPCEFLVPARDLASTNILANACASYRFHGIMGRKALPASGFR